jgi:predicted metal-binding membrane protein
VSGATGDFFASLFHRQRLVVIASLSLVVVLCIFAMQWSGDRLMMLDSGAGAFLYAVMVFIMWWTMMMAMMLPTAVPALLTDAAIASKWSPGEDRRLLEIAFALGYVSVWTAFALIATAVNVGIGRVIQMTPMMAITSQVVGVVLLALAGLYQLTPAKQSCLVKCQSPIAFRPGEWRAGTVAAYRRGLAHGLYCTGCCGPLMLLLFYGGVMEANWIGGLALYVLVEKLVPAHWRLHQFTGALLILWAGVLAVSLI